MTKTHLFRVENFDTGEVEDLWMDIEIIHSKGDHYTPSYVEYNITNWGKIQNNEKPEWVTEQILNKELESVNLTDTEEIKDYDDYD